MEILDLHSRFRRYCFAEEGLRPNTIKGLKSSISTLIDRAGITRLSELSVSVVKEFFYEGIEGYEWSFYAYTNHRNNLKKFFNWCVKMGHLKENPIEQIAKRKQPERKPRRLSLDEAQKLLFHTNSYKWRYELERSRNCAIIALMLYSGLRIGEVMNLKVDEVDLASSSIHIINGKGGKNRDIPIHYKLEAILKRYKKDRREAGKSSKYFLTSIRGELPLLNKDIYLICKKITRASGIIFSPHCLRHTFASVSVEQGLGIVQLKDMLGHNDIASTMIYLKMSNVNLQESMNRMELF